VAQCDGSITARRSNSAGGHASHGELVALADWRGKGAIPFWTVAALDPKRDSRRARQGVDRLTETQATADGSKRSGRPGGSPKSNAARSPRSERRRSRSPAVAVSSTVPSAPTTTP
jgi:hypothetical protein